MKFQLTTTACLALLAVLDQSNAFSPRAFAVSSATLSPTKLRMSTSAQEEVAKLQAAAAKMREEAAQLEKVRNESLRIINHRHLKKDWNLMF
jgi:hypothetical protein